MEHCIFVARSVTLAQRMERALVRSGIHARIFRAPAGLSDRGCAYAVEISGDRLTEAKQVLEREQLRPLQTACEEKTRRAGR